MAEKCLSSVQMLHLKELGLNVGDKHLDLIDIIDLLPVVILHEGGEYELCIRRMHFGFGCTKFVVSYHEKNCIDWYVSYSNYELITSAYEMLCWCIKQGWVKNQNK